MKHKRHYTLSLLLSFMCFSLLSQEIYRNHEHDSDEEHEHADFDCDDTIHGIISYPLLIEDCTEDVLVTNVPGHKTLETHIYGAIATSGRIRIVPGDATTTQIIRIIPTPTDEDGTRHTTTKIGNGNTGRIFNRLNATKQTVVPNDEKQKVAVFPNPARNYISIYSQDVSIRSYHLTNRYGEIVKKEALQAKNRSKIILNELATDWYILTILLQDGTQKRKIILKQ